jgi:hypothetical protein
VFRPLIARIKSFTRYDDISNTLQYQSPTPKCEVDHLGQLVMWSIVGLYR